MTDPTQAPTVCYRHSDRPTRLACSECGRPICVECSHDASVGQKCPECSKPPGRYKVINARNTTGRQAGLTGAPVTTAILIIAVAIHIIQFVSPDAREWLYPNLQHDNAALAVGELWRMVTHAFLHSQSSIFHILFNMYILYALGPELERRVGSAPFALFYAAAAAAGSAAAFYLGPPAMIAVGASGAIFGLFGAWFYVGWRTRHTPAGRARFNQLGVLIAINLVLGFAVPGIAWQAHLGGLVAGLLIAWAWAHLAVGKSQPEVRRSLIAGVVLIVAIGAVAWGGAQAVNAAVCDDLLVDLQQADSMTVEERDDIFDSAYDRFRVAVAAGNNEAASTCLRVAELTAPSG